MWLGENIFPREKRNVDVLLGLENIHALIGDTPLKK